MSNEHKLLRQMTTDHGMEQIAKANLSPEVFEEPICRAAFEHGMTYWQTNAKHPTVEVLTHPLPALERDLPAEEPEEATPWLIDQLQTRYVRNQVQEMMIAVASDFEKDPKDTLRKLRDGADEALRQSDHKQRPHLRDRVLSIKDLASLPPVEPLIDGLLYRDTLAQLSGGPGSYKSFAAIGMACSIATGRPFAGTFTVPRTGRVVYVAPEGGNGIRARVLAWCEHEGVDPDTLEGRLYVLPVALQLGQSLDVTEAVEYVQEIDADLLVLDTRARCTLGLEENSATEQGRAIDSADQIRNAAGCTVLGVHHAARNKGDNAKATAVRAAGRGSNAWDGAVWTDLRMSGGGLVSTIECTKHKEVSSGCKHELALVERTVSPSLMPLVGEEHRRTLVIESKNGVGQPIELANSRGAVLDILWTMAPREGLTARQIEEFAKENDGPKRSSVHSAIKELVEQGHIKNVGTERRSKYVAVEHLSGKKTSE